jgi:hypothetical protein
MPGESSDNRHPNGTEDEYEAELQRAGMGSAKEGMERFFNLNLKENHDESSHVD